MNNYKEKQSIEIEIINNLNDIKAYVTEVLNYLNGMEVYDRDEMIVYFSCIPEKCEEIENLIYELERKLESENNYE